MIVRYGNNVWDLEIITLSANSGADIETFEFLDGSYFRKKFPSDVDTIDMTCQWVDIATESSIKAAFESTRDEIFFIPALQVIEPFYAHLESYDVNYLKIVTDATRYVTMRLRFTKAK